VGFCSFLERKVLMTLIRAFPEASTSSSSLAAASGASRRSMQWKRTGRVRRKRTLLRQQNGRNGIDGAGVLPERHHHSAWLQTIERAQDTDLRNNTNSVILMRHTKFHNFIILTIIMLVSHDSVAQKGPIFPKCDSD